MTDGALFRVVVAAVAGAALVVVWAASPELRHAAADVPPGLWAVLGGWLGTGGVRATVQRLQDGHRDDAAHARLVGGGGHGHG